MSYQTRHYLSGGIIGAATDTGTYNSGQLLLATTKYLALNNYDYEVERVNAYGKILLPSGIYVTFPPNSIGLQMGALNSDPSNPLKYVHIPTNVDVNIPLGLAASSGYSLPTFVWTYPNVVMPDGGGIPQYTAGTNVYIYWTVVLKRIANLNS
jgi:hypothetical protein